MVGCSIRNCKSRSKKGGVIRFYRFPNKESVANEWLRYCGQKTKCKDGRVCSKHFTSSDYFKPLRHILMNESPTNARKLKPDAIPTLEINSVEKSNSTELTAKSTVCTVGQTDNCETKDGYDISAPSCNINLKAAVYIKCKSESDTTPANNAEDSSSDISAPSCNINLKDAVHIKCKSESDMMPANNSDDSSSDISAPSCDINLKAAVHIKCKSESDMMPANNAEDSSSVVEESDKKITASEAEYKLLKRKVNEYEVFNMTPANNSEGSSNVVEESDKKITVSEAKYKQLERKVEEYEVLKNNLKQIFTSGQIRCLTKPDRRRVRWSAEDIAAAISLRSISPNGYRHLRNTVGIPLPAYSTLCKWASKFKVEAGALKKSSLE